MFRESWKGYEGWNSVVVTPSSQRSVARIPSFPILVSHPKGGVQLVKTIQLFHSCVLHGNILRDCREFQFLVKKINERERGVSCSLLVRKIKVDGLFRFSRVEILIRAYWDHGWKVMEVNGEYWNWNRTLKWIRLRVKSSQLFCSIDNIGNWGTVEL